MTKLQNLDQQFLELQCLSDEKLLRQIREWEAIAYMENKRDTKQEELKDEWTEQVEQQITYISTEESEPKKKDTSGYMALWEKITEPNAADSSNG